MSDVPFGSHKQGEAPDNLPTDCGSSMKEENQQAQASPPPSPAGREPQAEQSVPAADDPAKQYGRLARKIPEEEFIRQEAQLVEKVLQGDSTALEKLYETYVEMVYGYIFKRVKNEGDAQSLTSDIFFRAIEGLMQGRYSPQGKPFGAWLSGIAHNVHSEWKRKRSRESTQIPFEDLHSEQHPCTDEDMLESLIEQEQQHFLWRVVSELPLTEQRILILRYQYRLSYAEIAGQLHLTEVAAKQRHYRAMRALREKLRPHEDENQDTEL